MKRILSLILAVVMMISLLPAVTVFATTEPTEKTYYFSAMGNKAKYGVNKTEKTPEGKAVFDKNASFHSSFIECVREFGSHGWKYFDVDNTAYETGNLYVAQFNDDCVKIYTEHAKSSLSLPGGSKVSFALQAPSAGYYKLSTNVSAANIGVYAGPRDAEKATVEGYTNTPNYIGESEANSTKLSATNDVLTFDELDNVIYSDGSTDIIFALVSDYGENPQLKGVKFNPLVTASEPVLNKETVALEMTNDGGTSDRLSLTIDENDIVSGFVSFTSGNKEVAEVNENGKITATGVGETEVTVSVGNFSKKVPVTVTAAPGYVPSVSYHFTRAKLAELNDVTKLSTSKIGDWWDPTDTSVFGNGSHWYPSSVVGFGKHGWKFFDVSKNVVDLVSADGNNMRLIQFQDGFLPIYNSVNKYGYIENDTAKLSFELEAPEESSFYSVTVNTAMSVNITDSAVDKTADFYMSPVSEGQTAENEASERSFLGSTEYTDADQKEDKLARLVYLEAGKNAVFTIDPQIPAAYDAETKKGTQARGIKLYSARIEPVNGELAVNQDTVTLDISSSGGGSERLAVMLGGKEVVPGFVSFSSDNEFVAEVAEDGTVTAIEPGGANITVKIADFTKTVPVTVTPTADYVPPAVYIPEKLSVSFDKEQIELGEAATLSITDENGDALNERFVISTEIETGSNGKKLLSEENGVYTAIGVGRSTVTVTARYKENVVTGTGELAISGSNLINRNGIDHGNFENGVYFSDKTDAEKDASFWESTKSESDNVFEYSYPSVTLPGEEDPRKALKISFDGKGTPNPSNGRITFKMQTNKALQGSNKHRGLIIAEPDKLYEFTGWVKAENTENLADIWFGLSYHNCDSSEITDIIGFSIKPWTALEGDQEWQKLVIPARIINRSRVKTVGMLPYFQTVDADKVGDILLSDFAVREVVFDRIDFKLDGDLSKAKTYDTFATSVKPLSDSGNEILPADTTIKINYTYNSSDESVATVSEDGTITVLRDGECTIYATSTICGVTQTAELPISLSGLEVCLDKITAEADGDIDVGETSQITARFLNTDGTDYTGELTPYYTSDDGKVARVDQKGLITAINPGKTNVNVYVVHGGRTIECKIPVKVNDTTPIVSAGIQGSATVELGFKTTLSAYAIHESGSAADMDDVESVFELSDTSEEGIITISEKGVVTGLSEGKASVVVTVTSKKGGSVKSQPFEITVTPKSPKSKVFDFSQYPLNTSALNQTIENDGFEINRDLSSAGIISGVLGNLRYLAYGINAKVSASGNSINADTVIDVKIDYDGWYEVDFKGAKSKTGSGLAYIYLDGTYLGEYNFYNPEDIPEVPAISLNNIYLTADVHQFTIRTIESGDPNKKSSTRGQCISSIAFRYLSEKPEICAPVMTAERATLAVGESVGLNVEVPMSNGRVHNFGLRHGEETDTESNLNITSSDSSVAKYEAGKIVAEKEGSATFTASALVYGQPAENTLTVTVTDEKLSRVENLNVGGISLYVGDTADIELRAFVKGEDSEEREIAVSNIDFSYNLPGDSIAEVTDGKITATAVGSAMLEVTATLDATQKTSYIPVTVLPDGFAAAKLGAVTQVLKLGGAGTDLFVRAFDNFGKEISVKNATVDYTVDDESIISVDDVTGRVTPKAYGVATVTATVTIDGITHKTGNAISISVREGKVSSTYYTPERVATARENIKKYDWARDEAEAAIEKADKWLPYTEYIYNMITNHTIPRSCYTLEKDDPDVEYCAYCGAPLKSLYAVKNMYSIDPITRPWKIQCADCKRLFPSNDFGSFYENGLNEHGEFDRTLALENNGILCKRGERNEDGEYVVYDEFADNPYGYGDPKGNLWNETYSELYPQGSKDPFRKTEITQGWGDFKTGGESGVPSAGYFWGVDDGLGYDTGYVHANGVKSVRRFIAVFNYGGVWFLHGKTEQPLVHAALNAFRDAYLYTGDKKYGIAGAIILDRVADLYPDFDYGVDCVELVTSGNGTGKISGYIHENFVNRPFTMGYDAFFDVYDEPEVISFLSEYAEKWNLDNKKTNGELLRQNVEDNILCETYRAIQKGMIKGNFGMSQHTLALAAAILDREPETTEWVDFIMRTNTGPNTDKTGLDFYSGIMNEHSRDGDGNESSPAYNGIHSGSFIEVAEVFDAYGKIKGEYNLLTNPRVIKSFLVGTSGIIAGNRQANIGDNSEITGRAPRVDNSSFWLIGFRETANPIFAQLLYLANGNSAKGIRYDIFTPNPESVEAEIEKVIEEYGEYDLSKSQLAAGYGLAVLRDGVMYDRTTAATQTNTMRDWWMYFGSTGGTHKHRDALNLGIDAFGVDMAPDLGYFASGGIVAAVARGESFGEGTIAHNTVLVNDSSQTRYYSDAFPLHFEDAGDIKVMDVDVPGAYPGITDTYRRTVVSVDIDDTVSYALDFFRIIGGDEHVYSFHSQSEDLVVDGLDFVTQPGGSYAGVNVPYGDEEYNVRDNGLNWLKNVKRAVYPGTGELTADFKITDYQKTVKGNRNFHLKLTQLNDFEVSEVATAEGAPVDNTANPDHLDWLLIRRSGKNLDTLFTTVLEPYEDNSKIESLSRVKVTKAGAPVTENERCVAVKVELKNGRCDYIVYAANDEAVYTITDDNNGVSFDFCGFVGVYSVNNSDSTDVVRTYLHDGKQIGTTTAEFAAVTGRVVSFTDTNEFENKLEITAEQDIDPEALVGRMINIHNDGEKNAVYIIENAEKKGENFLLDMGDITFVRSLDPEDESKFILNFSAGDTYEIPMTASYSAKPDISVSGTFTTSAGSSISIPIDVESDREYTLIGTSLPRGMSLNSNTGVLAWKPDGSQVGDNHVAVTVDNGVLSDTVHFIVTVYGSTTSKPSDTTDNTETPSTGASGGGGGGGGGAAPTPDKSENDDESLLLEEKVPSDNEADEVENGDTDNIRFIDLGNHAWAENAINSLAADGIIRGTSGTTFSPASNITRADFALLLVRAFKLSSDNAENFADVAASDYFAPELAIARNTGIVNGIGDNKYAPRNTITRQDMMVIVYRALKTLEKEPPKPRGRGTVEDGGGISPSQYPDFANVADYAKEAVSALIGAGLVNGKNGSIAPTDYTTRAEVAVLIRRIMDYVK